MTFIVDASVAMKWFVPEEMYEQAQSLLFCCGGDLEAPDLLVTEVANIAWKKFLRNEITHDQARAIPLEAYSYLAACHPSIYLLDQALEIAIALNHPIYDCIYLACAIERNALFITADKRFFGRVQETEFAENTIFLGDWPTSTAKVQSIRRIKEIVERLSKTDHIVISNIETFLAENQGKWPSPIWGTLFRYLDELPQHDLIDIYAICLLGLGDADDYWSAHEKAFDEFRSKPKTMVIKTAAFCKESYLEKGLHVLKKPC